MNSVIQKTIAVDFDGVLSDYRGWQGDKMLDPPLPGAIEWIATLVDKGFAVVIHTTRNPDLIRTWLETWFASEYGNKSEAATIPARIKVTNIKPPAWVYIEDRAICYRGGTYPTPEEIEHFRAWWQALRTSDWPPQLPSDQEAVRVASSNCRVARACVKIR
jgi:adenylylsulfate kinase